MIIETRSPVRRVGPPPAATPDPDAPAWGNPDGLPVPHAPRPPLSKNHWRLIWFVAIVAALVLLLAVLHWVGLIGGGSPAPVASRPAATALPTVPTPAPSPAGTTPPSPAARANFAPPSPVPAPGTVDANIGFTTAQCLWWKQYDKTEFATRVTGVYGDIHFNDRPDMNYKDVPAAVVACQDHVNQGGPPDNVASAKSRDAMEPAPKSGLQTILDALTAPFAWLAKFLHLTS